MADESGGRWVTINGAHVFIKDGETSIQGLARSVKEKREARVNKKLKIKGRALTKEERANKAHDEITDQADEEYFRLASAYGKMLERQNPNMSEDELYERAHSMAETSTRALRKMCDREAQKAYDRIMKETNPHYKMKIGGKYIIDKKKK